MSSRKLAVTVAVLLSGISATALAKNGAFKSTAHGDAIRGPQRNAQRARGGCAQCHDQHLSHDPSSAKNDKGLFAPNDNNLCFVCHTRPSDDGIFTGAGEWSRSGHGASPLLLRGGADPRPPTDAGKCINCHDPHGVKDSAGVIPALLDARETDLCVTCHDGSRGADIKNQLATRAFRHGMNVRGKHDPHEGGDPARFSALGGQNRHVGCGDCHNVHSSTADRVPALPPRASSTMIGVSRVQVANGPAGTAPNFSFRAADDAGMASEYEICFKCHSSWTRLPPGKPDLALLTNPANASFHPIQAQGKNTHIDANAFASGYAADTIIACTSCHGSDDPSTHGPHASSYEYLLKKRAATTSQAQMISATDLCFDCHAWSVYGDPKASAATQRASRFNAPSGQGHVFHVAGQRIPCYACHETHGSVRQTALISINRFPGMTSYAPTPNGGTCDSSCHSLRSYTVNYAR